MDKTMRFDPASLKELGRRHWKEFNPRKYQQLVQSGQLEQSLEAAVNMTLGEMEVDRRAGYSQDEAWEKDRSLFLLLPEEYDPKAERMPPDPSFEAMVEKNRAF